MPPVKPSSTAQISPLSSEITAYEGYSWDERNHRLESRPELNENNYGGFHLEVCRTEGALGGRIKVSHEQEGADQYTPENIRKIKNLLGVSDASSAIVLDREANQVGHICVQATDPQWLKSSYRRVKDRCEKTLGKEDPKNSLRCEILEKTLKLAAHEESFFGKIWDTLPVGIGFFVPGAIAGGVVLLGKSVWSGIQAAKNAAAPALMVFPNCSSEAWKEFTNLCPPQEIEI